MVHLAQVPAQVWAEPVAEARASVQAQPSAAVDETGWRERRPRAWLWGVVTAGGAVLVILLSRRGQVARALLGERCWGWLVTDRWSASTWSPNKFTVTPHICTRGFIPTLSKTIKALALAAIGGMQSEHVCFLQSGG
jgi:hypothetical protein